MNGKHSHPASDTGDQSPSSSVLRLLSNYRCRLAALSAERLEASPGVAFDGKPSLDDVFIVPELAPAPFRPTPRRACVILGPAGSGKSYLAARLLHWHSSQSKASIANVAEICQLVEDFDLVLFLDRASAVTTANNDRNKFDHLIQQALESVPAGDEEASEAFEVADIAATVSWASSHPDRVLVIIDCADAAQVDTNWLTSCFAGSGQPAILAFARRMSQLPDKLFSAAEPCRLLPWSDAQIQSYIDKSVESALPDSETELKTHFLAAVDRAVKSANGAAGFLSQPGNLALLVTLYHLDPARFVSGPAPQSSTDLYDRLFHCLFAEAPSAAAAAAAEAVKFDEAKDVVVGAAEAAADFADVNLVASGARLAAFLTAKRLCLRCLDAATKAQLGNDAPTDAVVDSLADVWRRAIDSEPDSDETATDAVGPVATARTVLTDFVELLGGLADDWLLLSASRLEELSMNETERNRCQRLWRTLKSRRYRRIEMQNQSHWLGGWSDSHSIALAVSESEKQLKPILEPQSQQQEVQPETDLSSENYRLSSICLDFELLQCRIETVTADNNFKAKKGLLLVDDEDPDEHFDSVVTKSVVSSFANLAPALEPWERQGRLEQLDCLIVRCSSDDRRMHSAANVALDALNKVDKVKELRLHCPAKFLPASAIATAVVRAIERSKDHLRRIRLSGGWLFGLLDCPSDGLGRVLARLPNIRLFGLHGDYCYGSEEKELKPLRLMPEDLAKLEKFLTNAKWRHCLHRIDIQLDGFCGLANENCCHAMNLRKWSNSVSDTTPVAARFLSVLATALPQLGALRFHCRSLTSSAVEAEAAAGIACLADLLDAGRLNRLASFGVRVAGECRQGDCLQQACLLLLTCERLSSFEFACGSLGSASDSADADAQDDASHVALLMHAALVAPCSLRRVQLLLGDVPEGRIRWLASWLATANITPRNADVLRHPGLDQRLRNSLQKFRIAGKVTSSSSGSKDAADSLKRQLLSRGLLEHGCVELDLR